MERDRFGLPIKKTNSERKSERVTSIKLNQPPRLLSAPVRKAINPFVDPIPPKPRNPFDDEPEKELKISDIFSSTHSYKQLSTHGNTPDPPEEGNATPITDADLEINDHEEFDEEPHIYRLSQERHSSRQSFKNVILKAERNMYKRGYGEDIVAVDKNDDNAVVRFLLSQRSKSYFPYFIFVSSLDFCSLWLSRHRWNIFR